jgi:hypothetical protein
MMILYLNREDQATLNGEVLQDVDWRGNLPYIDDLLATMQNRGLGGRFEMISERNGNTLADGVIDLRHGTTEYITYPEKQPRQFFDD